MELIDTHAHIYLPDFESDIEEVVKDAKGKDILNILMPAIDSGTHDDMMGIEAAYPCCLSMIGLHPCSVRDDFENELGIVDTWLQQRKFIAIGEIGLDFYWDTSFKEQQYIAFKSQINLALQYDLPVVIHSRNATQACIEVVKQYPGLKGVFHCFSGTLAEAEEIIKCGLFLGIGGVVTFKNGGLDKVLPHIELTHLMLETDAPYLAPVPFRGKRNQSSYLSFIAEKVAAVTNRSVTDVAAATTANAKSLFRLQ